MGRTRLSLATRKIKKGPIFPRRFVVEICEKVHTHYKNIRIVNTIADWVSMAEGFRDALDRWKKRGCPGTRKGQHIELCRKKIYSESENDNLLINLNENLYLPNKERIFSDGAEFSDPYYIHLKIRDIRIELSIDEFKEIADAVGEAKRKLEESNINSCL